MHDGFENETEHKKRWKGIIRVFPGRYSLLPHLWSSSNSSMMTNRRPWRTTSRRLKNDIGQRKMHRAFGTSPDQTDIPTKEANFVSTDWPKWKQTVTFNDRNAFSRWKFPKVQLGMKTERIRPELSGAKFGSSRRQYRNPGNINRRRYDTE
jgi:hypothetical protein